MRKRVELTDKQKRDIVKHREAGKNWTEIWKATGVPRHACKRYYLEWQHESRAADKTALRQNLVSEYYKEHIELVVAFGERLERRIDIAGLPVPAIDSEEYLAPLWTESFQVTAAEGIQPLVYSREPRYPSTDRKTYLNNRLIFKALQDHTRGKIRWESLDEWKSAWDGCRDTVQQLRYEIDQTQQEKMDAGTERQGALMEFIWSQAKEQIKDQIIDTLWGILKYSRLPADYLPAEDAQTAKDLASILVGDSSQEIRLPPRYREEVQPPAALIVEEVMGDISGSDSVKQLVGHLDGMVAAYGEIGEKLNSLLLRPILLSTRCDLCPV